MKTANHPKEKSMAITIPIPCSVCGVTVPVPAIQCGFCKKQGPTISCPCCLVSLKALYNTKCLGHADTAPEDRTLAPWEAAPRSQGGGWVSQGDNVIAECEDLDDAQAIVALLEAAESARDLLKCYSHRSADSAAVKALTRLTDACDACGR